MYEVPPSSGSPGQQCYLVNLWQVADCTAVPDRGPVVLKILSTVRVSSCPVYDVC